MEQIKEENVVFNCFWEAQKLSRNKGQENKNVSPLTGVKAALFKWFRFSFCHILREGLLLPFLHTLFCL